MKSLHPIDIKLGRNLAKIRTRQDMSAEELGSMLSTPISYQQIRKYERGENRMAARIILEFCVILNCEMKDMFAGVTDLIKSNPNLDPYAPPLIEPYILDDGDLPEQHKAYFRGFTAHLNNQLSRFLTRNKDVNNE